MTRSDRSTCVVAIFALVVLGCGRGSAEADSPPAAGADPTAEPAAAEARLIDPVVQLGTTCVPGGAPKLECEYLHALVVAQATLSLEEMARRRDQRWVPSALRALELHGEPALQIAAVGVLAGFLDTPELAERVAPLLDSAFLDVQRASAQLLAHLPDSTPASVGREWIENHGGAAVATPYDELDFPEHYDEMGFPEYPGAERYTPADSDRSIGWWSADPAATVAARLAEATGVETMSYAQWGDRVQQLLREAATAMFDPSKMAAIQDLTEQYMKKPDPALIERIEAMQKELSAPADQAGEDMAKAVDQVATPPGSAPYDQVWFLVAEPKPGRDARVIVVYRQPGLERTVMQMAWDLRDYPPAWKPAGEDG